MAPRTVEQIQRDYDDEVRRAERWDENEPERAKGLREAEQRRADAYRELAESETASRRAAELENSKAALRAKYPRADPTAIRGDTPEALEAAAKASHDHVEAQVKAQQESDRAARRVESRTAWTGGQGSRVGLPGGEIVQQASPAKEAVEGAWNRTAEIIGQAKVPGHLRRYVEGNNQAVPSAADPEMAAWQDYKVLHPQSGMTFEAFLARNAGRASFVETTASAGAVSDEDKRG